MNKEILNSSKAPEPVGAYPHARKFGNLLFLSGVGPRERGTKKNTWCRTIRRRIYPQLRY